MEERVLCALLMLNLSLNGNLIKMKSLAEVSVVYLIASYS